MLIYYYVYSYSIVSSVSTNNFLSMHAFIVVIRSLAYLVITFVFTVIKKVFLHVFTNFYITAQLILCRRQINL